MASNNSTPTKKVRYQYIPPRAVLTHPTLLKAVRSRKSPGEAVRDWNARLEVLRQVYCLLRDEQQVPPDQVLPRLQQIFLDPLDRRRSTWYRTVHTLLGLAHYLETGADHVPLNRLPLWAFDVPVTAVASLVRHALTCPLEKVDGRSRRVATYTLVGAYLWHQSMADAGGTRTKWIYGTRAIYESAGFKQPPKPRANGETFLTHAREDFQLSVEFDTDHKGSQAFRTASQSPRQHTGYLTKVRFTWPDHLPLDTCSVTDMKAHRIPEQTHQFPPLEIPDRVRTQLWRHQWYHPTMSYQAPHPQCPLVLWDAADRITIPIIPGIVPMLLTTLIPFPALYRWAQAGGIRRPNNSLFPTLWEQAAGFLDQLDQQLAYPPLRAEPGRRQFEEHLAGFPLAQYDIMQRGLPIDLAVLRACYHREQQRQPEHTNLAGEHARIRRNVQRNGGLYQGVHRLLSKSGRIHTRQTNIQGLPKYYRPAVRVPDFMQLIAMDVVSHDASVLFNIAQDAAGLQRLHHPFDPLPGQSAADPPRWYDPYYDIAATAYPGTILTPALRQRVKAVFNPWLYGMRIPDLAEDVGLAEGTVETIRDAIQHTFPGLVAWLRALERAVWRHWTIPAALNPLGRDAIPMPRQFKRRVAPMFLIQRVGSSLLKQTVNYLEIESQEPVQVLETVHDSILCITEKQTTPLAETVMLDAMHRALQRPAHAALTVLNVTLGHAQDWATADATAEKIVLTPDAPPRNLFATEQNPPG